MQTKACNRCTRVLPLTEFTVNKTGRFGRFGICRECVRKAQKEQYRAKHPIPEARQVPEGMKRCPSCKQVFPRDQFSGGHCKPCHQAISRKYAKEHPEKLAGYAKQDRERHPERFREYDRKMGPTRRLSTYNRGRLIKITGERFTLLEVAERDQWVCGICGFIVAPADASLDHVVPLAKGGTHTFNNVQIAHKTCNVKKGARLGFKIVS